MVISFLAVLPTPILQDEVGPNKLLISGIVVEEKVLVIQHAPTGSIPHSTIYIYVGSVRGKCG